MNKELPTSTKTEPPKKNTLLKVLIVIIGLYFVGSLLRSKPAPPEVPKAQAVQTETVEPVAAEKPKRDIFDTKVPAAPDGDEATVALQAIRVTRTPCESVAGARRRDNGTVFALCHMGDNRTQAYLVFTERVNSELRINVMTCRAAKLQGIPCYSE